MSELALDLTQQELNMVEFRDYGDQVLAMVDKFKEQHTALFNVPERARLSLGLVDRLRSKVDQSVEPTEELSPQKFLPTAQVDIIEWYALRDLWFYGGGDEANKQEFRDSAYHAQGRVFDVIAQYDRLFQGSPQAYEDFVTGIHQARLLVKNPEGLLAHETKMDEYEAGQMLAVYRVVKGLGLNKFPQVRYPTMKEIKDHRIDAVIPIEVPEKKAIFIKVQPLATQKESIVISPTGVHLLVDLPYCVPPAESFELSKECVTQLEQTIIDQISSLQTEVNPVELAA